MVKSFFIIFGCLALGELVVALTGIKFPSSIIGLILLTVSLQMGIFKVNQVKKLSDFLLDNISFFIVPPGVALMLYFDLIKDNLLAISVTVLFSTALVMIVTGYTHQALRRWGKKRNKLKNG